MKAVLAGIGAALFWMHLHSSLSVTESVSTKESAESELCPHRYFSISIPEGQAFWTIEIDERRNEVSEPGFFDSAFFCGQESDMSCIESSLVDFAVPAAELPESWSKGEIEYRASKYGEVAWFGRRLFLYEILSYIDGERHFIYQYSAEHGLVSFARYESGGLGPAYLVHGDCGFGARENCCNNAPGKKLEQEQEQEQTNKQIDRPGQHSK